MRKNNLVALTALFAAVLMCCTAAASTASDENAPSSALSNGLLPGWSLGASPLSNLELPFPSAGFSVPPPDTPSGPSTGIIGKSLTYKTKGTDPLGVHDYMFDWGDGSGTSWKSDDTQSHAYKKAGTFKIIAKEKCPLELFETDWSDAKTVKITSNLVPSAASATLSSTAILYGKTVRLTTRVTSSSGTPTGRVNFEVARHLSGVWRAYQTGAALVSGRATSKYYTPWSAGDFDFRACYTGSTKYATSRCTPKVARVTAVTKTSTLLNHSTITLGNSVKDTAKVASSSLTPTGKITFEVSKVCGFTWTPYGVIVTLSKAAATSSTYTPQTAGVYYFRALYGGDRYHSSSRSNGLAERLLVNKADTDTLTELSDTAIALGAYVTDTATVTGLGGNFPDVTGTVDFQVSSNAGATWTTYDTDVALVDGSAMSKQYSPANAGSYLFRAIYNGDDNYDLSQSGNQAEPLTVSPP